MTDERGFERTTEIRVRRNMPSQEIIGLEQMWVRYRTKHDNHGISWQEAEREWREVETA